MCMCPSVHEEVPKNPFVWSAIVMTLKRIENVSNGKMEMEMQMGLFTRKPWRVMRQKGRDEGGSRGFTQVE